MAKKQAAKKAKARKKSAPKKAKAVKKSAKKIKVPKQAAPKKSASKKVPAKKLVRKVAAVKKVKAAKKTKARVAPKRLPKLDRAFKFVSSLTLPKAPPRLRSGEPDSVIAFTAEKTESLIVGSDIVTFAAGLPEGLRTVVSNSLLLAQLAATQKVADLEKTTEWYKMYFNVLTTLGWVIQEQGFTEHEEKGSEFEVHKAILAVATTVFSGGATALAIITSTLNALEKMGDGPWLTIFKKKSQRGKAARFQVTVVEPVGDGGCMISLMAFELEAEKELTQVLFFKFNTSEVALKHASGIVTLDKQMAEDLGPAIATKVRPFQLDFIKNIPVG